MSAQKIILSMVLSTGLLVSASAAFAKGDKGDKGDKHGDDKGAAAPELAGHGAPAALALIAGGAAIIVSRRRRQS